MGLSIRSESDVCFGTSGTGLRWVGQGTEGWGCSRGSGACEGIPQDRLKPLLGKNQRCQEGGKRAGCLKSKGRDAVGMGNGCESRIESWRRRREKGVLANSARLGPGRVCALFHGALSIDGCRSELEDSMFPSPLSRTVDNVLSLSCSFHRNHNHHWEIALMSNWKSVSLQRSTRWLWSALWVHLGEW